MKKLLVYFNIFAIVLCSFVMLACSSDNLVGSWELGSVSYEYQGQTKIHTVEQLQQMTVDETCEDRTSEEYYKLMSKYVLQETSMQKFVFNANKTITVNTTDYKWERKSENKICILMDEKEIVFSQPDSQTLIYEINVEDGVVLFLHYTKK